MALAQCQLQQETRVTGAETSMDKGHVQEMEEIWSDIKNMVTPIWMTSVPLNLGFPDHSKLKADQWHALGDLISSYLIDLIMGNGPDWRPSRA